MNVTIDAGHNISMNNTGTFTIVDGAIVSNFDYRKADASCYYQGLGTGGFYHRGR